MATWVIIPVKRLSEAKSSLSPNLTPKQRKKLVLSMLADVLNSVHRAPSVKGVVVVSPDKRVLDFARLHAAEGLAESGFGLNEALKHAIRHAIAKGESEVLILPADLPTIKTSDIENIIAMASSAKDVVIAPSNTRGTNALFLRPPNVIDLRFGGESFPTHVREALKAGVKPRIYRSPFVSLDIDEVADLEAIRIHGIGTNAYRFLLTLFKRTREGRTALRNKLQTRVGRTRRQS